MTQYITRCLASVIFLVFFVQACWIPLPEDTAILVQVVDTDGGPVDGVQFNLDGSETLTTGSQAVAGQVFKNLSVSGIHTLQLDTATLIDAQGGIGWIPLASRISGDLRPLSFYSMPFAGGSSVLTVPVNKGEVTVVTIYLDDILKSPGDNQWLTDGADASSNYRSGNGSDEFAASPEPVFWWRQDPSLGMTVSHTLQFWVDDDGDTRYPLGIIDSQQYDAEMKLTSPNYRQPHWQIPLAGVQRAVAAGVNEIAIWSGEAVDLASSPVVYDLYYAPAELWVGSDWERNPVFRSISHTPDGSALRFDVGSGTSNGDIILKNGTEYVFALRARDAASNLDTSGSISTRKATPKGSASSLGSVTIQSAYADSAGGRIVIVYDCHSSPADSLRIYAAPRQDFEDNPYDVRFIRETVRCASSDTFSYVTDSQILTGLVNNVEYAVGMEPFDSDGNAGTASSIAYVIPNSVSPADTVPPSQPAISVSTPGSGQVTINVSAVSDSASTVFRRVYWAPISFTANPEAMFFTDLGPTTPSGLTISNIPGNIAYNYAVRAIDDAGNSSMAVTQYTLGTGPDIAGPEWATDDPDFFASVVFSTAGTAWPLGLTWKYDGFALGCDPENGEGEYVWRVVQVNPVTGVSRSTKLGAFYTWSGYYYAATEFSVPVMSGSSADIRHRDVFNFIENGIESADVMGAPFDSNDPDRYRQRTAALFSGALAYGSTTVNQLVIQYNTDEDGQPAVFQGTYNGEDGYAGNLRVIAVNKQPPSPRLKPYLRTKEFRMSYFTGTDSLVMDPVPSPSDPAYGGSVYYEGTLDEPDFVDPRW